MPSISFSVIIAAPPRDSYPTAQIIAYGGVICCSYNLIIIKSLFTVKTFGHGLDFSPTPIRHGLSKEKFYNTLHHSQQQGSSSAGGNLARLKNTQKVATSHLTSTQKKSTTAKKFHEVQYEPLWLAFKVTSRYKHARKEEGKK